MSDDQEPAKGKALRFNAGGAGKPPPPRTIAAQSRARNSFIGLVILGGLLGLLMVGVFVSLDHRPEHVKDLLILVGTISGYIAGALIQQRKDEP